jgi:hypothetical protein
MVDGALGQCFLDPMTEIVLHHISGAVFGIGLFAAWLGHRWTKEATKNLEAATAFYQRHADERKAAVRTVPSESK